MGLSDWVLARRSRARRRLRPPASLSVFGVSVNLRCDKTIWCYRRAHAREPVLVRVCVFLGAVGTFEWASRLVFSLVGFGSSLVVA